MLETRNLVKIYMPKKGIPVTALDKVNLKFPETGMVFLLGKSGSGKSTLLNVLGGLDNYNNGEIIIKGVSSRKFKQQHFDSYRNTYVGFIFQEYNILEDFTVGANIALAIELQNRKAQDSDVNDILKQVDLEGYGSRKPNELSGGQKQRVAIARALVKNPQIIMADEPTGALDSTTGRQVLETLKKLSREKLVIVVSHDREFAEQYADRIIELSDGRVISDVEVSSDNTESKEELVYDGNTIEVPCGYHITEYDRKTINEYIEKLKEGSVKLSLSGKAVKKFKATDESAIKSQDASTFKLIKSKLPLKNAFKIGASSLKHKKIRLVITILLSCISFGLFGLADTFGAYNHIETCTNSLYDSNVQYISTGKAKLVGEDMNSYWRDYGYLLSKADLDAIEKNTSVKMHGVYLPIESNLNFEAHIDTNKEISKTEFNLYNPNFSGYAEINTDILTEMGFTVLSGTLPDGTKNEIAVSEYIFEVFEKMTYTDAQTFVKDKKGENSLKYIEIENYTDLIGKTINIDGVKYTITAIVDTNFNLERYLPLMEEKPHRSDAEMLVDYVLYNEFSTSSAYSYTGIIMVGDGFINKLISERPQMANITEGYISFYAENFSADSNYLAKISAIKDEKIVWLDGAKTTLGEKEIIVTRDALNLWETEVTVDGDGLESDYISQIKKNNNLSASKYMFNTNENLDEEGYKIVGVIESTEKSKLFSTVVCSEALYNEFTEGEDCYYSFCVGAAPKEKDELKGLVSYCYREDSNLRYQIQNSVTYELDSINLVLKQLSKIFLYIGLGFAAFAALMLANFIAISISYKKQEIGILRAIGSRSNDVFRIFFAESFIIAMINFVLSAMGTLAVTLAINFVIRKELGALITLLSFGPRQIVLLFAVSLAVAFVASFIPVKRIASKRPIDAIRNR